MNSDNEDRGLLRRIFERDEEACNRLYHKYRNFAHHLLGKAGITGQQALDCMQDVFTTVMTDPKLLEIDTKFSHYFKCMLFNKIKDFYRHKKRYKHYAINENGEVKLPPKEGNLMLPDALLQSFDDYNDLDFEDAIRMCLKKLPRTESRVIIKLWLENIKIRHIAEALHIPEGSVSSMLNRARVLFKKCMRQNFYH